MAKDEEQGSHEQRPKKKIPHIIFSAVLLLVVLIAGCCYGVLGRTPNYVASFDNGFSGRKLSFSCNLVSVDATAGNIVLSWLVVNDTCTQNCTPVNIFFDPNLAFDGGNPGQGNTEMSGNGTNNGPSNSEPSTPIFTWGQSFVTDPRASTPTFRTPITIISTRSLQYYPFDKYTTEVFLYATDTSNNLVGVTITNSTGIAVGFSVNAFSKSDQKAPTPQGVLTQEITIVRGAPVKAYAIIITIAVWLISLIFLFATTLHLVFGYAMKAEFLVVPIATLFTVTQLRQTMPGAPDFGTVLDFAALLPCLALMSVCATLSIGALALLNFEKQRRTIMDRLLRKKKRDNKRQKSNSESPPAEPPGTAKSTNTTGNDYFNNENAAIRAAPVLPS